MQKRRAIAEINVVPYIDVMLVLLVVFMVTAPMLTQGIALQLPKVTAPPLSVPDDPVILSINRSGDYFINTGEHPKNAKSLAKVIEVVETVLVSMPNKLVMVEADAEIQYQYVLQLIAALKKIGAANVGFVTDPEVTAEKN